MSTFAVWIPILQTVLTLLLGAAGWALKAWVVPRPRLAHAGHHPGLQRPAGGAEEQGEDGLQDRDPDGEGGHGRVLAFVDLRNGFGDAGDLDGQVTNRPAGHGGDAEDGIGTPDGGRAGDRDELLN